MRKTDDIRRLLEQNREALIQADSSSSAVPNGICYDGIVDETVFYSDANTPRVIFLLKETNGNDAKGKAGDCSNDWNYRDWLEHQQAKGEESNQDGDNQFYRTFYALCMWLDVFRDCVNGNVTAFSEYRKSGRLSSDSLRRNLCNTAIINLKKTWGGGSTSWSALNSYLKSDAAKKVLCEQIKLIEPNIVICGGHQVFDFAKEIFGAEEKHITARDKEILYFKFGKAVFLDFYHPACRKSREFLYNYSVEVFQTLLEKGLY
ncbi:MAG: hypothetical protein ACI4IT_07500 [Oscillospiraceae bacterium]